MRDAARRADRLLQVGLLMRSLGALSAHQGGRIVGRARTPAERRDLAAGLLSPSRGARPQGALRRSLDRADDFRLRFHPWLMGAPGDLSASAARSPAARRGEISALLHYPDGRHATVLASGLMPPGSPFSVGLSRPVRRRGRSSTSAVFDERRAAEKHLYDRHRQSARPSPCRRRRWQSLSGRTATLRGLHQRPSRSRASGRRARDRSLDALCGNAARPRRLAPAAILAPQVELLLDRAVGEGEQHRLARRPCARPWPSSARRNGRASSSGRSCRRSCSRPRPRPPRTPCRRCCDRAPSQSPWAGAA